MTGRRRLVRELGLALVTAGFVVLLFVAYELVGTNLSEEQSQAKLARAFNAAVSAAPAPAATRPPATTRPPGSPARRAAGRHKGGTGPGTRPAAKVPGHVKVGPGGHAGKKAAPGTAAGGSVPVPPPGGALDHMVIPAIGIDRYVVEGVGDLDLQMGPGHYPGTPLPGQDGNVGIAGHRTTFGAPFFRLNELVPGDLIYLTDTEDRTWVYDVVQQWVVPPSDIAVLDATHKPVLTLTTCNPRFEATTRLVVRADLLERLPRGAGLANRLPKATPAKATPAKATPAKATPAKATPAKHTGRTARPVVNTPRSVVSTLPVTTTSAVGTSRPSTTAVSHSGQAPGSAGGDSPTVGPPAASASSSGGEAGAWGGAVGWGALALAGWAVTRVIAGRRNRYIKVGVLVCGALVCLVPLWFTFTNVVNLLPANL